jgi:hypothetical protein
MMIGKILQVLGLVGLVGLLVFFADRPQVQAQGWGGGQGSDIRQIRPLRFGQITRPAIGTNTFTLHWQNNNVDVGGSGDGYHMGGASSGFYQIRGQPNQAVTITAHVENFSADGVLVDEIHVNGPSNGYVTTLAGGGMAMIRVGGVVSISANATVGLHYTVIYLDLNYE